MCIYTPFGSPFYAEVESSDGIHLLMSYMLDLADKNSDCDFMLCGDFNARTGGYNATLECDIYDTLNDPFCVSRSSKDKLVNPFGSSLLTLCLSFNLTILNGAIAGDTGGDFTYLSVRGDSIVDYFIVSNSLASHCVKFSVTENVLSSHMGIELVVSTPSWESRDNDDFMIVQSKLIWNENTISRVTQCQVQFRISRDIQ